MGQRSVSPLGIGIAEIRKAKPQVEQGLQSRAACPEHGPYRKVESFLWGKPYAHLLEQRQEDPGIFSHPDGIIRQAGRNEHAQLRAVRKEPEDLPDMPSVPQKRTIKQPPPVRRAVFDHMGRYFCVDFAYEVILRDDIAKACQKGSDVPALVGTDPDLCPGKMHGSQLLLDELTLFPGIRRYVDMGRGRQVAQIFLQDREHLRIVAMDDGGGPQRFFPRFFLRQAQRPVAGKDAGRPCRTALPGAEDGGSIQTDPVKIVVDEPGRIVVLLHFILPGGESDPTAFLHEEVALYQRNAVTKAFFPSEKRINDLWSEQRIGAVAARAQSMQFKPERKSDFITGSDVPRVICRNSRHESLEGRMPQRPFPEHEVKALHMGHDFMPQKSHEMDAIFWYAVA